MMMFKRFQRDHFPAYQSWFVDTWLNDALGPMDEEWLEHILKDNTGAQYAILEQEQMVAVLGVVWANEDQHYHTITDLAIHPGQRRKGFGVKVLHHVVHQLEVPKAKGWITYVNTKNVRAIEFMKKCAWSQLESAPMYAFRIDY
ncbi:MAG: GNAT family N-acetyltransferase [Bacteroidota bacterium]